MKKGQFIIIYRRLLKHYSPQHWWPGDSPFEVMVGAILTQSAAWQNVAKAIANLKAAGALSPAAIRALPPDELAALIRPSGYFNAKAKKLKALVDWLGNACGDNISNLSQLETADLRASLLAVWGIGPETADSILLYALERPVFVIDAYTPRICSRLGISPEKDDYASWQTLFTANLPRDRALYNEYHALLVRHAKERCCTKPICQKCFLFDICRYHQAN